RLIVERHRKCRRPCPLELSGDGERRGTDLIGQAAAGGGDGQHDGQQATQGYHDAPPEREWRSHLTTTRTSYADDDRPRATQTQAARTKIVPLAFDRGFLIPQRAIWLE